MTNLSRYETALERSRTTKALEESKGKNYETNPSDPENDPPKCETSAMGSPLEDGERQEGVFPNRNRHFRQSTKRSNETPPTDRAPRSLTIA